MYLRPDDPKKPFLDDYKKYNNKPPQMEGKIINYIGKPYQSFLQQRYELLAKLFDEVELASAPVTDELGNSVVITQWFENKPIRIQLTPESPLFQEMFRYFSNEYQGHTLNELTITRNCVTAVPSAGSDKSIAFENGRDWMSELWHIDAFGPYAFKIGIYLTDVDEESGPYEHIKNPEAHFFAEFDYRRFNTRFRDLVNPEGVQILGEAYDTFIFHPAVIHKGNYARTKHRDAIMVGFDYIYKLPSNIEMHHQNATGVKNNK